MATEGTRRESKRGLASAMEETRARVARSHDRDSLRDAGRKGGQSVKTEYGIEFYKTIAGGKSVKQKYGRTFTAKLAVKVEE